MRKHFVADLVVFERGRKDQLQKVLTNGKRDIIYRLGVKDHFRAILLLPDQLQSVPVTVGPAHRGRGVLPADHIVGPRGHSEPQRRDQLVHFRLIHLVSRMSLRVRGEIRYFSAK